jgi:hypothetical protein
MSTKYPISVASDALALGDAVVGYWNSGMTREVKRANASTLAVMPTVLGIVNEFDVTPGHVTVALPGELADHRITGLNPGGSLTANIVAVDPSAPIGASNLSKAETRHKAQTGSDYTAVCGGKELLALHFSLDSDRYGFRRWIKV